jgi:hypothetical protein
MTMEDIVLFNRVCISNFRDEREAVLTRTKSVERARHWDAADQRIPQEELAQLVLVFGLEDAGSSVTLMKWQLDRQMLKHVGGHQKEVRKVNHRIYHMVKNGRDKGQLLNIGQPLGLALDGIRQTLELIFRAEEEPPVAVAIRDIRHSHTDARKCAQISAAVALQVSGDEGQNLVWEVEKPKGPSHCFFLRRVNTLSRGNDRNTQAVQPRADQSQKSDTGWSLRNAKHLDFYLSLAA